MALAIVIVSLIRFRIANTPIERDEGEYAYIGNLILQGLEPFKYGYSMKLPGTSLMYALIMFLTEHNNRGIHLGLMCMNAYTMYFLFSAFSKLYNVRVALVASTCYGFLALSPAFYGFAAHATQFIVFYCSMALFFLSSYVKTAKNIKLFLFALMLGMAFIMKQQAMFFILFGLVFVVLYQRQVKTDSMIKTLFIFCLGVALPYAAILVWIYFTGQFSSFWLWTIQYATQYESEQHVVFTNLWQNYSYVLTDYWYLWLIAICGIVTLYTKTYKGLQRSLAMLYFEAALLALGAGLYFRPHYFVVVLPVIGLFAALAFDAVYTFLQNRLSILNAKLVFPLVVLLCISINLYANSKYYFFEQPTDICANAYDPANVFTPAPQIAAHVNQYTGDTGKVAILGSEPEVYFYTGRAAATGYLYTFPLVENQPYNLSMQMAMAKEIENTKPLCIVYYRFDGAWSYEQGAPRYIYNWAENYLIQNYTQVESVFYDKTQGWQFYKQADVTKLSMMPQLVIAIYRRNKGI